jgi:hypothetical protein
MTFIAATTGMPVSPTLQGNMRSGWHGQRKSDMAIFSLSSNYFDNSGNSFSDNVLFKVKTIF